MFQWISHSLMYLLIGILQVIISSFGILFSLGIFSTWFLNNHVLFGSVSIGISSHVLLSVGINYVLISICLNSCVELVI